MRPRRFRWESSELERGGGTGAPSGEILVRKITCLDGAPKKLQASAGLVNFSNSYWRVWLPAYKINRV